MKFFVLEDKQNNIIINNRMIKKIKTKFYKNTIFLSFYIIILFISNISKSNFQQINESLITGSYIKMKIPQGTHLILANNQYLDWGEFKFNIEYTKPNEIYINGIKQKTIKNKYIFNETINTVILIWNNTITDCKCMFCDCFDITEIDLSHFDTSQITDMIGMFHCCHSLNYLNLSNINTSQVTNMRGLFYHCYSLTSLDLSYFDTSKVTNTREMFCNSFSLYSLNLANFNTSQVIEMLKMFSNCTKLIYINLENAELKKLDSSVLNQKSVFTQTSDSLVICSKDNKWNIGNLLLTNCKNNSNNNKEYNCYTRESIISYNKYLCNTCGNNYYQIDNDEYNDN